MTVKRKRPERAMGPIALAKALGKDRKTIYRWSQRADAPVDSDGRANLEEYTGWATAAGLLERPAHRPTEVDRLSAPEPVAPVAPTARVAAVEPAGEPAFGPPDPLDDLTKEDREALEALVQGDATALINLASRVNQGFLKRLAFMGRTRKELAEAEKRELENKARRKELVEIADVRKFWGSQIEAVKQHFAALPGKLAPRLVEKTYDEIYQAIDDELHAVLEGFAQEVPA